MKTGCIYILTNSAMPNFVKIGYADDVNDRVRALNSNAGIPMPFEIYATYEVGARLEDKMIHTLIDTLNPNLRSTSNVNGKSRIREFFRMSPEDAYTIFDCIAKLNGAPKRLKKFKNSQNSAKKQIAKTLSNDKRSSPFSFEKCKIPAGAKITFCFDQTIAARVVDDRHIEYDGKITSLTALAKTLLGKTNGIAGPLYFKYKGKILNDLRHELGV